MPVGGIRKPGRNSGQCRKCLVEQATAAAVQTPKAGRNRIDYRARTETVGPSAAPGGRAIAGCMLRTLYDRVLALAGHRHALAALAAVSFLESWIFPIPPDVMLIPMVLARPERAFLIAGVCLAASVAGGIAGYAIGAFMFEELGQPVMETLGLTHGYAELARNYGEYGFWAVFVAGLTPIPYKIITILSGALGLSIPLFVAASIVARGLRFFLVAALLWKFGPAVRDFIERRFGLVTTVACAVLVIAALIVMSG